MKNQFFVGQMFYKVVVVIVIVVVFFKTFWQVNDNS